ncbi:hypothetical protein HN51_017629 [Arachis hypogaea]
MNNDDRVLSIPLKKTDPVELYLPLRKLVVSKYSENDAQKVESVLETLNKCRRDMVERRGDLSLPMQRDCLIHYFKCLSMVELLFTSISSDADVDPVIFVWYDAFNPDHQDGVSSERNAIQLEKAAVVFNLGAICSQIAASCDRTTALGRHLAMEAFKVAANFFLKLWKVFAKGVVSATLDLTRRFAKFLHLLFSAQASELELREQFNNNDASSVYKLYRRAYELIPADSAAWNYVNSFDQTWVPHLCQKATFFEAEARQWKSSILPKSKRPFPEAYESRVQSCAIDQAECVTETLVSGICSLSRELKPPQIYVDLILSEYNPFKITKDGKLVAYPWDMPPPYPINSAILSSPLPSSRASEILAFIPLKKSEPLNDLYESLRSYFVLKYSESVAKRVEGFLEMLHKLRNEMLRDDLSLPFRRDCLVLYFKCLCMIEPFFPMKASPNPPVFVWYNAIIPQHHSSQHNIHLEKASVLFNLGALCIHIALSCDQSTIHGYRLAKDALKDAFYWNDKLRRESKRASGTIDLSGQYFDVIQDEIHNEFAHLKRKFHRHDVSSLPDSANMSRDGPLANYDPSDVTEQFLLGYCKAHSLLHFGADSLPHGVCEAECLDLLSEFSPVKIEDGNLVANAILEAPNLALENMSLQETTQQ